MCEFRFRFHWSLLLRFQLTIFNNIPALVHIIAWHWPGDKPLFEPMMISLRKHICITQPQWVEESFITLNFYFVITRCHTYIWHELSWIINIGFYLFSLANISKILMSTHTPPDFTNCCAKLGPGTHFTKIFWAYNPNLMEKMMNYYLKYNG